MFHTDDNLGINTLFKQFLPGALGGCWNDAVLLGTQELFPPTIKNLWLWLLPARIFTNWIHALFLLGSSVFLWLYLRARQLAPAAAALGVLAAFWLGSNFTLIYPGHLGKFGVLMCAAACLWCLTRALQTGRWEWSALAGGALGQMFVEQQDVALFVASVLGPYALLAAGWQHGWRFRPLVRLLAPLAAASILLAGPALWTGYQTAVRGVASLSRETPLEKWEYCTQWSWPPEESIDFIAPGFTGWRSGEPAGPYWGRMGRSAGWEQTGRGFANFKLENQYLGALPLALAALAVLAAARRRRAPGPIADQSENHNRREVFFWAAAAAVTLLLAFGKYFPLYQFFYRLPGISAIRNPNKFLQVFQLAVAILAAHGLDLALRGVLAASPAAAPAGRKGGQPPAAPARGGGLRLMLPVLIILSAVLATAALVLGFNWAGDVERLLRAGWGEFAAVIQRNKIAALWHGAGLLLAAAGCLWLAGAAGFRRRAPWLAAAGWAVALVTAADAVYLSRHYVQTMPLAVMAENDVIRRLKNREPGRRAALVTQAGFYNHWLTYLFPYHGIRALNIVQMPRMPVEYQRFLEHVGRHPLRLWQLSAVDSVLAPAQFWGQVQQDTRLREALEPVLAYNVLQDGSSVKVIPATAAQPGQHALLRLKAPAPYAALLAGWETADDAEALRRLADDNYPLFQSVCVAPESAAGLPAAAGRGLAGTVRPLSLQAREVVLDVTAESPAILRLSAKHDPDWQARINGQPAPVRRVDYIFQGVFVEPGRHQVTLRYAPPAWPLWTQLAGVGLCLATALRLVFRRRATPALG